MPSKLSTTISKIATIPNPTNSMLITEFHKYMETSGASERHQNNSLKMVIAFAFFIGEDVTFYSIKSKEQICSFLDTKIKNQEQDPDKRWITTWNYYLVHLKRFFRWLHNYHNRKCKNEQEDDILESEWITPPFINIKKRKTKRLSPYSESEIWEKDEVLTVIKYEPYKRNKAALSLLWDLDARNHEVTLLKIKNIRLKERYGEGEIPHESKTGTGPILLTCSLPYVRDWLNEHPFRNEPNARLICNLLTGGPIKPDSLSTVMKQLRRRILRLLESGSITDDNEHQKLEHIIKTKKWNPYCIRHSAITADSDFLPEYALKKKVRWSMNSKQGARYIKTRMGNDLKQKILAENGIFLEQDKVKKPSVLDCPRCSLVNVMENKYCSKCSYPLVPSAFDEIKANEDMKFRAIEEKFNNMQLMIEKLITISTQVQDRQQFNAMAQSLFMSGILKSEEQK
jgi:integrase/recombinase XerD